MRLAETDVLVLGAGLAGLRAAWAVLDTGHSTRTGPLKVTVAWSGHGPSGSSFANRNDGWGLFAPQNDAERERFTARAREIAPPGRIDPELVAILAEESAVRLHELAPLDIRPLPRTSRVCFAPDLRAAVFRDSRTIFTALADQTTARGGELLPGVQVLTILRMNGAVCGALLLDDAGELVLYAARAIICALGGPAPLFPHHVAGAVNPGTAPALLAEAGATLDSMPYMQWMWHELDTGRFVRIDRLAGGAVSYGDEAASLPEPLALLAQERAAHCPRAYDLPTEDLDMHLGRIAFSQRAHGISVQREGSAAVRILPHAHAANGGARIDADGRTNVPGLWACGESAAGMHGANRLGGAMIAAALVFGRRAGMSAIEHARWTLPEASVAQLEDLALAWIETNRRAVSTAGVRPDPHRIARALFLRDTNEARAMLADNAGHEAAYLDTRTDPLTQLVVLLAAARLRESVPPAA